ncbi:MAG TPA: hypothetical protein VEI07_18120 [Planctomycetaceae bacterium]|nr:hypothetical protein [Planctomycetaceae bacterium]
MAPTKRRYSKEEMARRGDAIYKANVLPRLGPEETGKFAAIDIETGNFEIDVDELTACDRLSARVPDPQIWLVKVGSQYLHRFGGRA